MLHKRGRSILQKLLKSKTSARQLSEEYELSPRTIRYDLEAIDNFLKENNLPTLSRKGGVSFAGNDNERLLLIKLMENTSAQATTFLPEERLYQIILILLSAKSYLTFEEIAQMLDVSKNTVISDLNKIRAFYPYQSAKIEVMPRRGICISGAEQDIRESVISFLFAGGRVFDIIFLEDKIARCLRKIAKTLEVRLDDSAFIRLLLYLKMSSVRIAAGHMLDGTSIKPDIKTGTKISANEFANCQAAAKMALTEIIAGITCPTPAEYKYFASLIADHFPNTSEEIHNLLLNLVRTMEQQLGITDLLQDAELMYILESDIQAIVGKKSLLLPPYEDIGNQLLQHYPNIYEAVSMSVSSIEDYVGRRLTRDELNHLMIPFAEAAQRKATLSRGRVDILVVCGAGLATSRLLCYQLMARFDVNIVDAIAFNQLGDSAPHNNVDLIISTIPLSVDKPNVLVSPFLTAKDLDALKAHLPTKVIDHKLFINLIKAVEKNCHVHNSKQLAEDIADILRIKGIR